MSNSRKKVIVIGAGLRGKAYAEIMKNEFPEDFEVVGVAEPVADRRKYIVDMHGVAPENATESWEPLLERERFADIAVIGTMDRDHLAPALAAIEKGYNLLLEKPIAPTPEDCMKIVEAAEKKGVFVLVCHVLRFTDFFIALKSIIDSGEIGKIVNIQHFEGVGNVHQSHSFVRGNWGVESESSFMLLQKSCHDTDILAWLIGKKCKKVQSFGALTYFKEENAPEGAPERCIDGCPHADECPYNAVKLYLDPNNMWFRRSSTKLMFPTDDDVRKALRETRYGKCVFRAGNDVVDHQVVNLEYEDDICVSFTMSAFNLSGRVIRIMGTKGEIEARMEGNVIKVRNLLTKTERDHDANAKVADESIVSGHGGGDSGIIRALRDLLRGERWGSICEVRESAESHMVAFAAEESRRRGGELVYVDEYIGSIK